MQTLLKEPHQMTLQNKKRIHPCPNFIALQIKYWRKKRKLTQKNISKITKIKIRHYQEIESGNVDIKIRTFGAIANALEITPHKLLTPLEQSKKFMCGGCQHLS